jgi:tetratricopeptide (TPR) repeat protein
VRRRQSGGYLRVIHPCQQTYPRPQPSAARTLRALVSLSAAVGAICACATDRPAPPAHASALPAPAVESSPAPEPWMKHLGPAHLPLEPQAHALGNEAKHRPPPIAPQDVARAKKLLEKGLAAYRKGDYDHAEQALKQAMTLYPFFAEANLALGKIFLIRGSATLDRSLINNARLMFEMAHTLDPTLPETDLLLELFQVGTPP